jgi:hypothetical protein
MSTARGRCPRPFSFPLFLSIMSEEGGGDDFVFVGQGGGQKTADQSPLGDGMEEVTCLVAPRDGKGLTDLFPAEVKIDSSVEKTSP